MQDFRKLKVWESAHTLTLDIYKATATFPKHEQYGLISQIQRAAVSISANIAEGCAKATDADFARYLQIALGSSSELEYLLLLARDLSYLSEESHQKLSASLIQVRKMLNSFLQTLRAKR